MTDESGVSGGMSRKIRSIRTFENEGEIEGGGEEEGGGGIISNASRSTGRVSVCYVTCVAKRENFVSEMEFD